MQESHSKISSSIDIVKFLMAIQIMICHGGAILGFPGFEYSFIYVEWFFIFMGYTTAKKIANFGDKYNTFHTSCEIIKSRVLNILPYYIISTTIALILKMNVGDIVIEDTWSIYKIIFEYLLLFVTGAPIVHLTDVSWFLSAMVFSLIILVPLGVKYKHKFFKWAIVIFLVIYGYFYFTEGNIYGPAKWTILGYKGLYRGIGSISLGFFGYELSTLVKYKLKNYIFDSIIIIASYAAIFCVLICNPSDQFTFLVTILFMLLIVLQMNSRKFIIPDCNFTRMLSKLSIVIYLNHYYVFFCIKVVSRQSIEYQFNFGVLATLLISLFVYYLVDFLKYIKSSLNLVNKV